MERDEKRQSGLVVVDWRRSGVAARHVGVLPARHPCRAILAVAVGGLVLAVEVVVVIRWGGEGRGRRQHEQQAEGAGAPSSARWGWGRSIHCSGFLGSRSHRG